MAKYICSVALHYERQRVSPKQATPRYGRGLPADWHAALCSQAKTFEKRRAGVFRRKKPNSRHGDIRRHDEDDPAQVRRCAQNLARGGKANKPKRPLSFMMAAYFKSQQHRPKPHFDTLMLSFEKDLDEVSHAKPLRPATKTAVRAVLLSERKVTRIFKSLRPDTRKKATVARKHRRMSAPFAALCTSAIPCRIFALCKVPMEFEKLRRHKKSKIC